MIDNPTVEEVHFIRPEPLADHGGDVRTGQQCGLADSATKTSVASRLDRHRRRPHIEQRNAARSRFAPLRENSTHLPAPARRR
jgi:hypothetical protein